ncbi:MAG: hypothetical protein CMC08_00425 [Flavobacteriaceae bacterium]|nr:hypothetical protein [Flavobacteriaceae bacterium]|tara:strand:+ start:1447 stop:1683 length:237 start_codon:yes stop_codon:yes gene_type:complete
MRIYTNFEEIDRDLRFLRLQSQINKEEVKLTLSETKESLSPIAMVTSLMGAIAKKALILKAVDKLLGMKKVKKEDMHD